MEKDQQRPVAALEIVGGQVLPEALASTGRSAGPNDLPPRCSGCLPGIPVPRHDRHVADPARTVFIDVDRTTAFRPSIEEGIEIAPIDGLIAIQITPARSLDTVRRNADRGHVAQHHRPQQSKHQRGTTSITRRHHSDRSA